MKITDIGSVILSFALTLDVTYPCRPAAVAIATLFPRNTFKMERVVNPGQPEPT